MLIASIVVICLFAIFLVVTFCLTIKSYTFKVNDNEVTVKNRGSKLKILINGKIVSSSFMPQLLVGEKFDITIDEENYQIKCLSNAFGNKLRVEILKDGEIIQDNGVEIKKKEKTSK